jgi:hypothetical protein
MSDTTTRYVCPVCGIEVFGNQTPNVPYLCTGIPGSGHTATAVVPFLTTDGTEIEEPKDKDITDVELGFV